MRRLKGLGGLVQQKKWEMEAQGQGMVAHSKSLKARSRGLSLEIFFFQVYNRWDAVVKLQ